MADLLITVSQLKCACVDPAWRARWMRGENPPTMQFAKKAGVPVQGQLFHQLAEHYTEWLESQSGASADLADADAHWAHLYDRFAKTRLDELIAAGNLPSALHLKNALRAFCGQLATLRAQAKRFAIWQDVYLTREYKMDRVRLPIDDGALLVSGRPDAVRLSAAELEVVDYKLSRGSNLKHDLVQLAIYAKLLRITKPGLVFSGALEFYEPALHLMIVPATELSGLFDEVVWPVIQELAGVSEFVSQEELRRLAER